jgi:hypothetical protein
VVISANHRTVTCQCEVASGGGLVLAKYPLARSELKWSVMLDHLGPIGRLDLGLIVPDSDRPVEESSLCWSFPMRFPGMAFGPDGRYLAFSDALVNAKQRPRNSTVVTFAVNLDTGTIEYAEDGGVPVVAFTGQQGLGLERAVPFVHFSYADQSVTLL